MRFLLAISMLIPLIARANTSQSVVLKPDERCLQQRLPKIAPYVASAELPAAQDYDFKQYAGKTYPLCGYDDELVLYRDEALTEKVFSVPICFLLHAPPLAKAEEKSNESSNIIFFHVEEDKGSKLKVSICDGGHFWIARDLAATPELVKLGGKKYLSEFMRYVGQAVQHKKVLSESFLFAVEWCGERPYLLKIKASEKFEGVESLRAEMFYERSECDSSLPDDGEPGC